uniref:Uncharacterized protein n=1 Tax=Picea glauca TaxID=3330 RepID=A0A101M4J2_PICGL|nr:hypothetical protein ABT39_MTgene571 [Picea glauca]
MGSTIEKQEFERNVEINKRPNRRMAGSILLYRTGVNFRDRAGGRHREF